VTRKYPLEPVQRVRDEKADAKARALAEALRAVEASTALAQRRAQEHAAHERARQELEGDERALLEGGGLKAADLAQQSAWAEAARLELLELARRSDEAAQALIGAHAHADVRRSQLQTARADAKVIAKHREAFDATAQRAALARDDEAAEEAHQARRAREKKP
jgi:hypothetical protein